MGKGILNRQEAIQLKAEIAEDLCSDLIAAGENAVIIGEALAGEGKISVAL